MKKKNLYNSSKNEGQKYDTVLFVETTPGGQLAKMLKQKEAVLNKENDWRIKIVEKSGIKLDFFR